MSIKYHEVKLEVEEAFKCLLRKNNKSVHYNRQCFAMLTGREMKTFGRYLSALYQHHLDIESGKEERNIYQLQLIKKSNLSSATITGLSWKFAPIFVNVTTAPDKQEQNRATFYSLTENGLLLVEKLKELQENV